MRYSRPLRNIDGRGSRRVRRYSLPPCPLPLGQFDFWAAVTDCSCPCCPGRVRWAEAGFVPGYRVCDSCGRHWLADGTGENPALLRVGSRRSRVRGRA